MAALNRGTFYPKDDTSGCTREACEFRDSWHDVEAAGAVVLGVSPDGVASHDKFKRKYQGVFRTTFVIDERGAIARVFEKVKPAGHAAEVLEAIRAL